MVNSPEVSSKVQILLFTLAVQCPYRVFKDLGLLHRGMPPKSRRQEIKNFNGKLHFTTLNYTPKYTLHSKLFGCTICTLNYNPYYTLHPSVSFTDKFDGNMKHVTFTCDLFKWDKCKRPKNPSSQSIKNIFSFHLSLNTTVDS